MSININSISGLESIQAMLSSQQTEFAKIAQSIATGVRADISPADKYISAMFDTNSQSLRAAIENAQSGMDLTSVASGALSNVNDTLGRIKELAIKAANDTYTTDQRQAIQAEINQLTDSIQKTIGNAKYGDIAVLNLVNSSNTTIADDIAFQVGTTTSSDSTIAYDPNIQLSDMNFDVTTRNGALAVISAVDGMIADVSTKEAEIAGVQTGLISSVDTNTTALINTTASNSHIKDTDYVSAMINLMQNQFKQESLISVFKTECLNQQAALRLITGA